MRRGSIDPVPSVPRGQAFQHFPLNMGKQSATVVDIGPQETVPSSLFDPLLRHVVRSVHGKILIDTSGGHREIGPEMLCECPEGQILIENRTKRNARCVVIPFQPDNGDTGYNLPYRWEVGGDHGVGKPPLETLEMSETGNERPYAQTLWTSFSRVNPLAYKTWHFSGDTLRRRYSRSTVLLLCHAGNGSAEINNDQLHMSAGTYLRVRPNEWFVLSLDRGLVDVVLDAHND